MEEQIRHMKNEARRNLKGQPVPIGPENAEEGGNRVRTRSNKALRVMREIQEFESPRLWSDVSHYFVSDGKLNLSGVLTATALPALVYLLCSGEATDVTVLELQNCNLTKDGFGVVCETIRSNCQEMTRLSTGWNEMLSDDIESHIISTMEARSNLRIDLRFCRLSTECCIRLSRQFRSRIDLVDRVASLAPRSLGGV
ncbi:hypothetical protein LSAT2_018958 [Lamellibrachia satsuma]|nr:hypothetical protein LSAT2_018958 [Lamellibrachia satsuma]